MSRFIRTISQSVGALAVLSMVCTSVAVASPTATIPASDSTATTATATVAPPSSTTTTADADDVAQGGPLSDVPQGHWAYDSVKQLVKDGLIIGYPDGLFKGNRPMTRYEVAVLAYRAVDQIEAQITAGKAVTQADIDAANKLLAAFGKELKAVETHVDALQKQADTTQAVAAATAATVRRAQIHLQMWIRAFNYDQSIQANNGPLPVRATANDKLIGPAQAFPAYTGVGPSGSVLVGPTGVAGGLGWGNQPFGVLPQNGNTIGNQNHGLGMEYTSLQFGGNPDDHSQYLVKLTNTYRYVATNYNSTTTPAYCVNAGAVSGATCTGGNAGLADADGVVNSLVRLQDMWYQYTSPGGIYVKVGKLQQDAGPKNITATEWLLTDYVNGGRIGYRNARLNVQAGYGFDDPAASQNTIYGIPASQQTMWGEIDYQLDHGRTDLGFEYDGYVGTHQTLWDPYAILCTGTNAAVPAKNNPATNVVSAAIPATIGTSKIIPLRNGQVFQGAGCGAGFAPISYTGGAAAGLPVTGAYVSTGAGAMYPNTQILGAFAIENYGHLRLVAEGTDKLGNDPFTGSRWTGFLSGYFQADYGSFVPVPGVKGTLDYEVGGYAAGFNSLGQSMGYYGGPAIWTNFTTDPSGYFFLFGGVKKYISDTASIALYYAHLGLLPHQIQPAGSPQCPGCSITGDSRNSVFGELFLGF